MFNISANYLYISLPLGILTFSGSKFSNSKPCCNCSGVGVPINLNCSGVGVPRYLDCDIILLPCDPDSQVAVDSGVLVTSLMSQFFFMTSQLFLVTSQLNLVVSVCGTWVMDDVRFTAPFGIFPRSDRFYGNYKT